PIGAERKRRRVRKRVSAERKILGQHDREAFGRHFGDPDDEMWLLARRAIYVLILGALIGLLFGRAVAPNGAEPPMFDLPGVSTISAAQVRAPAPRTDWSAMVGESKFAPLGDLAPSVGSPYADASSTTTPLAAPAEDWPIVAILIDDIGGDVRTAERVMDMPGPLSLSLLTNTRSLPVISEEARARGHELWLHLPMEPQGDADPGENALTTEQSAEELRAALDWHLNRFEGYIGVNNHMGSRFTADRDAMRIVLAGLKQEGLMFVDSVTTPDSVGLSLAEGLGLAAAGRDVFLDHDRGAASVRRQLDELERIAKAEGAAIAIAHPHEESLSVLGPWLVSAPSRGLRLAPVSEVVARRTRDRGFVYAVLD
ncbi:MAG: divergent polysaccharide deacetylase family protein, partial [Pseudomonadota bacterium]